MSSAAQYKVRVLTEDEFWDELRQFKTRQLIRWHDELKKRRYKTEGLNRLTDEFAERMQEIQAVQERELAELMVEQLVDNSIRVDQLERRMLGVVVWLVLIVLVQAFIILRSGIDLF